MPAKQATTKTVKSTKTTAKPTTTKKSKTNADTAHTDPAPDENKAPSPAISDAEDVQTVKAPKKARSGNTVKGGGVQKKRERVSTEGAPSRGGITRTEIWERFRQSKFCTQKIAGDALFVATQQLGALYMNAFMDILVAFKEELTGKTIKEREIRLVCAVLLAARPEDKNPRIILDCLDAAVLAAAARGNGETKPRKKRTSTGKSDAASVGSNEEDLASMVECGSE